MPIITIDDVRRFKALCQDHGLSQQAADWLLVALDPFNHVETTFPPMPSVNGAQNTVVRDVKISQSITKHPSITGLWDCHIAVLPLQALWDSSGGAAFFRGANLIRTIDASTVNQGQVTGLVDDAGSTTHTVPVALVVICQAAAGTDTFDMGSTNYYSYIPFASYVDAQTYKTRLIGGAFKVQNTTPTMYKGGAVTCYRQDGAYDQVMLNRGQSTPTYNGADLKADIFNGPPTDEDMAKLLGGVTYKAEEGCLVPISLNADPRAAYAISQAAIMRGNKNLTFGSYTGRQAWITYNDPGNSLTNGGYALTKFQIQQSGAYFTGLSAESSLEFTCRIGFEIHPNPTSDLITLSHPSAPYCPHAFATYLQVQDHMKPGYPAGFNATGSFFRTVKETVERAFSVLQPAMAALANSKVAKKAVAYGREQLSKHGATAANLAYANGQPEVGLAFDLGVMGDALMRKLEAKKKAQPSKKKRGKK